MKKILLDENIAIKIKEGLLKKGYDVIHINDEEKGITDNEVFDKAKTEERILITGDDDFKAKNFKYNIAIIWITPKARFEKNLIQKIDWIIRNIKNYNIDMRKAFVSIKTNNFFIEYKSKHGVLEKVKEREIEFSKIKGKELAK